MCHKWGIIELVLESAADYGNPYMDVDVFVTFTLNQKKICVRGFWDGDATWKVRFAPPEVGHWTWSSSCSDAHNAGLNGQEGVLSVSPYEGHNALYKHGFLTVNKNGRGLVHADGTPFFWMGDTVWAAPAHATHSEWVHYSQHRSEQEFNVVQLNILPQWDASAEAIRIPFETVLSDSKWDLTRPNPAYFQFLDDLCVTAVQHELFVALVVLWCNYVPNTNPEWEDLPRDNQFNIGLAKRFAEYVESRYSAFGAIWIVSGDTNYCDDLAISIYDAVGNILESSSPYRPLITAHLNGGLYTPLVLNQTSWLNFHMFQSCHTLQSPYLAGRYAAKDRAYDPPKPVINGEPCYDNIEFLFPGDPKERATRDFIRKTAWVSILTGATAGITYGAHGLWPWHRSGQVYRQVKYGLPDAWDIALMYDSADDFIKLKKFFERMAWWDLRPRPELLISDDKNTWCASNQNSTCVIVYTVGDVPVYLNVNPDGNYMGCWLDPVTGEEAPATLDLKAGRLNAVKLFSSADGVLVVFAI